MKSGKHPSDPTPFERMVEGILHGEVGHHKVEDVHPEDFKIIADAIAHLFFNQHSNEKGTKLGVEGFVDYAGTKIEFSNDVRYPATRKDPTGNYKIIVLPDSGQSEDMKQILAREALKDFDSLEAVGKYDLCLRIFHTFSEPELILLAKEYDPLKRDTSLLEKRLRERAQRRADGSGQNT